MALVVDLPVFLVRARLGEYLILVAPNCIKRVVMNEQQFAKVCAKFIESFHDDGIELELKVIEPTPATKALPLGIRAIFIGKHGRGIILKVLNSNDKVVCSISITNTKTSQVFNLLSYFKFIGHKFSFDDFHLRRNTDGSAEDSDISRLVATLITLPSLLAILDGAEWVDVPFDWSGMR